MKIGKTALQKMILAESKLMERFPGLRIEKIQESPEEPTDGSLILKESKVKAKAGDIYELVRQEKDGSFKFRRID